MKAPIDDGTDDEYQMEVSHLKPQGMQGWLQVKPGDEEHCISLTFSFAFALQSDHITNTFSNSDKYIWQCRKGEA